MKGEDKERSPKSSDGHRLTKQRLVLYNNGEYDKTLFRRSGSHTDYRRTEYENYLHEKGIPDSDEVWRSYCALYVLEQTGERIVGLVDRMRASDVQGLMHLTVPAELTFTISPSPLSIPDLDIPPDEEVPTQDSSPVTNVDSALFVNAPYQFRKHSHTWAIAFDGISISIVHMIGLQYIHMLLGRPDQDLSASLLVNTLHPNADVELYGDTADARLHEGLRPSEATIEAIEPDELKRLRELLKSKDEKIEEARSFGNYREIERLEQEKEAIVDDLRKRTDRFGRPRKTLFRPDRNRQSVQKAIQRALEAINEANPACAEFLRTHITTGSYCRFRSDQTISWSL
jgi:hypothetical protein